MPRPFLVAYDASPASRVALEHAAERAAFSKHPLVVVTVVPAPLQFASFTQMFLPGMDVPRMTVPATYTETARKTLEGVAAELRQRGLQVEAMVRMGDPADELLAAAEEIDAEQIWVGYKSYEKHLPYGLGSTTDKIVRYSQRTVTVVRPTSAKGP